MAKKLRQGKLRAAAKEKVKEKAPTWRARIKSRITSKTDKLKAARREWAETRSKKGETT